MVRDMEVKVGMVLAIMVAFSTAMMASGGEVTYDGRSLIINGERKILFSGSVHYPRSTPEMWPSIISKAKQGGIDVIQTYVFWNVHEPYEGQYNFEERYDLVRFIKTVQDHGLYVNLRVGPFIEAEWKYGGLPIWLREIPGIVFRSDNEPFKFYMKKYVTMIVNMMKSEKLYASQGGPIILSQIENEYQLVEAAFHEKGPPYVLWAASMAVSLQTGVPWTMCKQSDAPDPVINTCNGLRCGESFQPNSPNKPSLWTENWTALFQAYGEERHKRSVEDIAFNVALFIAKNGSFVNYYMYHGGTNFGRFASAYVTTSYYDEAPIDEYGLIRQPKWGHLKGLHAVIKESSDTLLSGRYTNFSLGQLQEAHVFQKETGSCVAFLVNSDGRVNVTVQFQSLTYELPPKSISILQDCTHVSFNTAEVRSQNGLRTVRPVQYFDNEDGWGAFEEGIPNSDQVSLNENLLVDQLTITKDETDYLWYTISYDHTSSEDQHMLNISSTAHVLHAFLNAEFIGSAHGIHRQNEGSLLATQISLKHGQNTISLLSVMVGAPDNGAYLERRFLGIRSVKVLNNQNQSVDLSDLQWGHQVGLIGERSKIYTQEGSTKTDWEPIMSSINHPLIWYKTTFDAPPGDDPLALDLSSMGKGEAYINGESIGRYWVSFLTPTEEPSQSLYHIPRSFLKPSDNLLVLFEEMGGNPLSISVNTVSANQVCSKVSEASQSAVTSRRQPVRLHLQCFEGRNISSIEFASYGSPLGDCGSYSVGGCHSFASKYIVEEACIGKRRCTVPLSAGRFRGDPCPGTSKSLAVIASCS